MKRLLATVVAGTAFLQSGSALPCMTMPRNLVRPHAEVVGSSKRIFLAEVVDSRPAKSVDGARKPITYSLRVIRVLKGDVGGTVQLDGEADLSGIWDTTFSDHTDEVFWKRASGRMGVQGNCRMVPPHFAKGKQYLLLLGGAEDTKQFERVDTPADRWLMYVAKQMKG